MSTTITQPTSDFIASTLNGALAAGATTAIIGTGLDIPAVNGILHLDPDSTTAVGVDNGPETISYATYTTGTGALTGMARGLNGTTDVAHANGAKVSAGYSVSHLKDFCGSRATLAADQQNITHATYTKIALDTETYDVGGNFASNKFTAPVNGYYAINAQVNWISCVADKAYYCVIYKNNAKFAERWVNTSQTSASTIGYSDVIYLNATDYIELYAYNNNASEDTSDIDNAGTFLSVHLVKEV